jgi:hypothetical protein
MWGTKRPARLAVLFAALGTLLVTASTASADYGGGAAKNTWQIEVSINCNNAAVCADIQGGTGGVWIWGELDQAGTSYTGDAEITFCAHGGGFSGAGHTSEDVTSWQIGKDGNFQITGGTDTDLFRGTKDVHPIYGDIDPTAPASPSNPSDTGVPALPGTYHVGTLDVFGFVMPGVSAQITVAYRPAR